MRAPDFWHEPPGLMAGLLAPFGAAWDAGARLRRLLARPYRAPVPVICIGNLVAGGSGKTPVVLSLAAMLAARGDAVHVVSRGYGGRMAGPLRVDPALHDAAAVGDEPLLIAAHTPCWVARERAAGVAAAVAGGAEIVLLDDGFQNPSVRKDCALIVVDAGYGFGNCRVIPAGPLREPVAVGLARADGIVLLGDGAPLPAIERAACPVYRARLVPRNGARLAGQPVIGFAGIGRPDKFFASLRAIGAGPLAAHPFPDHHRFTAGEIAGLRRAAECAGARLVTTAKDWVRLPPDWRAEIEVLEVEIGWHDAAAVAHLVADVARRTPDGYDRRAVCG